MAKPVPDQQELPIQPVEKPIICSPYHEPTEHWLYDTDTGAATRIPGRRPASYWYKAERIAAREQLSLFAEETREDLPLVNAMRSDVKRWRQSNYEGATEVTKELLRYWWREDRPRRLFFCQLEAVETIIFLNEIRLPEGYLRFKPKLVDEYLNQLRDIPFDRSLPALTRLGLKMATGSGKTVVMAMLIAWAFCNRGKVPSADRFPSATLVVCPNLTIRERLQVLRPDYPDNYYAAFDLVPVQMRPLLQSGKVLVTNWHRFAPESEHIEGGKSYTVVNKGPESPDAFARRVLGDLYDRAPIMVLNDEGHHAWRPRVSEEDKAAKAIKEELAEATVWVDGLDRINQAVGVQFCVDLSATPFYISGSGYPEGSPFPWLVSDFGLIDAIESGIVKIPRLPVKTSTHRPDPEYFRLWKHITEEKLQLAERRKGRGGKPDPEAIYREASGALSILMSQWVERFQYIEQATDEQDKTPPVLIIVCDNTDLAEVFFRHISGEQVEEVTGDEIDEDDETEDESDEDQPRGRKPKKKTKIVYGDGDLFPEYFSNRPGFNPTIRIDSKLLEKAESGDPTITRQKAAETLRRIVATVGKKGEPGEQVRCVVSVDMLSEGWDANNVTQILGLRAFHSQLLCEQVVGRGLRRMDYTPDPETGLLTEEYVDIYGVPFSLIPFKGREKAEKTPVDKPKHHVRALEERAEFEIRFPVVESYAFALRRNVITADIAGMDRLVLDRNMEPTAVYVQPPVDYRLGVPAVAGGLDSVRQDRETYYASTHLQAIEFTIARRVLDALTSPNGKPELRYQSRHQLFPQVLRFVHTYVSTKVDFQGMNPCELGHEKYVDWIVERLQDSIRPDASQGETPLLPVLNRYRPVGSTADVDFKTVQPCHVTTKSHVNLAPGDSGWELMAAALLEQSSDVLFYARNAGLGFGIPYKYHGVEHVYEPDFLVRLQTGITLLVEIKGMEDDLDHAKYEATRRWKTAVNNWRKLGQWDFWVNRNPQMLVGELRRLCEMSDVRSKVRTG